MSLPQMLVWLLISELDNWPAPPTSLLLDTVTVINSQDLEQSRQLTKPILQEKEEYLLSEPPQPD
ncbi:MAG: hypothetical protein CMM93_07035 [Rickettsiales bacterium]|nr:hypothetical protein [Rickettsiales bacterium]